jgi:sec-independent protein translocase protein TatC
VSIAGVVRLFSASPKGAIGEGGRMALVDHLRELRARLLRSLVVMLVALVAAFFFYDQLIDLVTRPYFEAQRDLKGQVVTEPVLSGAGAPLLLNLKLCAAAAVVVTSPYWLYQIWAFIVPGLHPHERRWSKVFIGVAGPLFVGGVAVGYYVLPKGLEVLIGFTPHRFTHLLDFGDYFSFLTRMLLIFGISFEIPLFVVLLNLAGVLPARLLKEYRPWIVLGVFIFAAVATPSTDPFSMLMLAIPMTILFFASELIARVTDRRRRRRDAADPLDDDEATPYDAL